MLPSDSMMTPGPAPTVESYRPLFEAQLAFAPSVRARPAEARLERLHALRGLLLAERPALREALYADFGKPPEEVDLAEIYTVTSEIDYVARNLDRWMRPRRVRTPLTYIGTRSAVRFEPKGVVLIIAPWNYPVNLSLRPLVAALAAGNCAVLKPSELVPHTSALLGELLGRLFPSREVAVVQGDAHAAQALLDLPFHHIHFTGSPRVGRIVMQAAARHLTSVTLELGGKSPVIVDASADLAVAARRIAYGKFSNAGQTCIAPDYALVDRRVEAPFLEALGQQIDHLYPPASPGLAHIVTERHHARLTALLTASIEAGARIVRGSALPPSPRRFPPTVLADVSPDSPIMEDEIFGPILPVLAYDAMDRALQVVQSHERPLALYIFSREESTIEHVLRHTTAGGTCVNDTLLHFSHPGLPFGGVNNSGIGKANGLYAFRSFSNERPVLRQLSPVSVFERFYPPYTALTHRLLDSLLRYF